MGHRELILVIFLLIDIVSICGGANETSEYWIQNADKAFQSTEYDLAIRLFDKALELDPNNTYALRQRGLSYELLGLALFDSDKLVDASSSFDEAFKSYNKAIEIDPNSADNWYYKGQFLFKQGRYVDALECYNTTLSISSNYVDAKFQQEQALYFLEEQTELWRVSKYIMAAIFILLLMIFVFYILWVIKFDKFEKKSKLEKDLLSKSPEEISHQIEIAIKSFETTENRLLKFFFCTIPWLSLILSANSWLDNNPMEASAFFTVSLSLLAFLHLSRLIPKTLDDLWTNGLITLNKSQFQESDLEQVPKRIIIAVNYLQFVKNFEKVLNSPCQWISGIIFAIIAFWIENYFLGDRIVDWNALHYIVLSSFHSYESYVYLFIGFVIGCMAWRMIAVGIQVFSMGWKLDIVPNLLHQDKCGGLSSLGYLCFWNVLITSFLGIFLAGWLVLSKFPPYSFEYNQVYIPIHTALLALVVEWLAFGFFLPLWGIHRELIINKETFFRDRGKLSSAIEDLRRDMLNRISNLPTEGYTEMSERLNKMIEAYNISPTYPTWPFNTTILKKLAISQVIPVITLLGAGDSFSKILQALVDTLS